MNVTVIYIKLVNVVVYLWFRTKGFRHIPMDLFGFGILNITSVSRDYQDY